MNGLEYDYAFIRNNPIASFCPYCKALEPINAPTLDNVFCFWCSIGARTGHCKIQQLVPADRVAYRARLAIVKQHVIPQQTYLFDEIEA